MKLREIVILITKVYNIDYLENISIISLIRNMYSEL